MNLNQKKITEFYILVFSLSLPFWILSYFININGLPDNLPVTDIGAAFVPMIAALISIFREKRMDGVKEILSRIFDYNKIKVIWYTPIIFLMPISFVITYFLMILVGINFPIGYTIPIQLIFIFIAFFIAAIGEELGYMGYAIDRIQKETSPLKAGLIIGALWAVWHLPSMIKLGQSPNLIIIGLIATIGFRIIYVGLYNMTNKSVFGIILIHAIGNTGRSIFPGGRGYFEKLDGIIGYSVIVLIAIIVTILWRKVMIKNVRFES